MSRKQVAGNRELGAGRRDSKAGRKNPVEESREKDLKRWEQGI